MRNVHAGVSMWDVVVIIPQGRGILSSFGSGRWHKKCEEGKFVLLFFFFFLFFFTSWQSFQPPLLLSSQPPRVRDP
jgi:hypothetical protein